MEKIAAIILAAGASTRFGEPKQLLDWHGVPLLRHVTETALQADLDPVIVVLGSHAEAVRQALGTHGIQTAMNWRWEAGMSTSVQVGLAALPPDTSAALFLQCDQPLVTADLLRTLAKRFRKTGAPIVHPVYAGRRGTPTLFARRLFPELAEVSGDRGGRDLISRYAKEVTTIEVAHADVLSDIDTRADYERLKQRCADDRKPPSEPEPGDAMALDHVRHLIVDMDGVLWRGDEPLPGLGDFFTFIRQKDFNFILATNNSSHLPTQYAAKLARFGVEVSPERILTSAQATAAYLADIAPPRTRVYAIGGEGVLHALEAHNFELAEENAAYVIVGWDRQLTWKKLSTASLLIHRGAGFVGTNPDKSYPTEQGPVPGNGAQLAALEATTGVTPIVVGKPEPWMYREALRRMQARPETTAVIGDRLETDIAGGINADITTILVLSGIARRADVAPSPYQPDLMCEDLDHLLHVLANDE
ncbi:MAG TPA: HAD-IIA family hydrolase [Chloroflexi bacterium]|nr:HAD-IIA family hydrolase [Chloroflexota bacterium]